MYAFSLYIYMCIYIYVYIYTYIYIHIYTHIYIHFHIYFSYIFSLYIYIVYIYMCIYIHIYIYNIIYIYIYIYYMHIYWWKYKLLAVLTRPSPAKLELFFSTLSLYLRWTGKQHWAGSFLVLVFNNLLQQLTISCKQYELLGNVTFSRSDVNIQNRTLMWVNNSYHNYHLFGKFWIFVLVKNISTLMSRLGRGA